MTTGSLNAELAQAARKVRSLNERIPAAHRLDVSREWEILLERVDGRTEAQARRLIAEWSEAMEGRLCSAILNAPLEATPDRISEGA